MVYMPVERTGRNRKLSRPYFGPYRVLKVHPNGLTVRPVDRPNEQSIRVNQDRVSVQKNCLTSHGWGGDALRGEVATIDSHHALVHDHPAC